MREGTRQRILEWQARRLDEQRDDVRILPRSIPSRRQLLERPRSRLLSRYLANSHLSAPPKARGIVEEATQHVASRLRVAECSHRESRRFPQRIQVARGQV